MTASDAYSPAHGGFPDPSFEDRRPVVRGVAREGVLNAVGCALANEDGLRIIIAPSSAHEGGYTLAAYHVSSTGQAMLVGECEAKPDGTIVGSHEWLGVFTDAQINE